MFGLFLCFVVPGIIIGVLLSASYMEAKTKARVWEKKRARLQRKQLYVHDLKSDWEYVRQHAA